MFGLEKLFERKEDTTFVLGQVELNTFQIEFQVLARVMNHFGLKIAPNETLGYALLKHEGFKPVDEAKGIYADPKDTYKHLVTGDLVPVNRDRTNAMETAAVRFLERNNIKTLNHKELGAIEAAKAVESMKEELKVQPVATNGRG